MEVVENNKISQEELAIVKELKAKQDQAIYDLGLLASQKHSLLHSLAEINQEVAKNSKILENAYGKVQIDLNTGEYQEIEAKGNE